MRIAVLSDIHGNSLALDAVLADMARHAPDLVVCLGDHVSGPVDPRGTAERLLDLGAVAIRGNHDRWVVDLSLPGAGRIDHFARQQLTTPQLDWLAALPAAARVGSEVFLCHGTPGDDEMPWLDRFFEGRTTTLPTAAEVAHEAQGIDCAVMLCGHTHVPRTLRLADGRLLANPGSVGMQLVRGSPDAHYGLVEQGPNGWQTALIAVPYHTGKAARLAADNGFPGWGASLRQGWAGPETLD